MTSHPYVDDYIKLWKDKKVKLNKDRINLIHYLNNVVLKMDGIYFDNDQIDNFVEFTEKWFFDLEPFQKFIICFVFLYFDNGKIVFNEFFLTMSRGAGKNGLISALAAYFISPLHGVRRYNVDIVANSEKQAKTSFEDVYDMLEQNPELTSRETGHFENQKAKITGRSSNSVLSFMTSNASTKDGFRPGMLIFDEIHQYENNDIIDVLRGGLGKVQPPRTFYIGTNGFVRDGEYDKLLERSKAVLKDEEYQSKLFPFLCTLDKKTEMNDYDMWQKANPMFHPPLSEYADGLFDTVNDEYLKIKKGDGDKPKFLTKRMNISDVDLETSVASRDEIIATNRDLPDDLSDHFAVGGLDYASLKDFAAVGLLFKKEEEYIWLTHSFIRKGFLDNYNMAISSEIPKWEREGLLTVVDEPTIDIKHISNWFVEMREMYNFNVIVGDTFRMDYVRNELESEGFEVDFVRRSKTIEATVAPQIEVVFAQKQLIWGENPLMNWYTNNVLVKRDKFGNMMYEKKDENRRKTDGFMAFTHAFWKGTELFPKNEPSVFMFADFWD